MSKGTGGTRLACPPEEIDLCRVFTALEPDCLDKLAGDAFPAAFLFPVRPVVLLQDVRQCNGAEARLQVPVDLPVSGLQDAVDAPPHRAEPGGVRMQAHQLVQAVRLQGREDAAEVDLLRLLSAISSRMAFWMRRSVVVSTLLVASSRISIFAS